MKVEELATIKRGIAAESEWSVGYLDFGAERNRVCALVVEVERLRGVLQFYADADHYFDGTIDHDVGHMARTALGVH